MGSSSLTGTIASSGISVLASKKGSGGRFVGWKRRFVLIGTEAGSRRYECGPVLRFGEEIFLSQV